MQIWWKTTGQDNRPYLLRTTIVLVFLKFVAVNDVIGSKDEFLWIIFDRFYIHYICTVIFISI